MLAQSWSYVGGSCPNSEGSAKIKIKANGNIVSASMTTNTIGVKEWNGSNWLPLPSPPSNGFIGEFHLEMHLDTVYLGIGANGFRVFKWTGSAWTQIGPALTGTFSAGNHDFLLDNNGVPVIGTIMDRKIQRMVGGAWQLAITLPLGGFPNTYAYNFGQDNSLIFNNQNELIYVTVFKNRQMVRKLTTTFEDQLVGDTAIFLSPFSQYSPIVKKNANGEIFVFFTAFGKRAFVKKWSGGNWQLYGDSSTFGISPGNMLFEIAGNGTLFFTQGGNVDKKVWACTGPSASFQQLDLISHSGNFTQVTDLDINPVDGKVHVAFNCLPTHSVMKYDLALTSNANLVSNFESIRLFPNPGKDQIFLEGKNLENTLYQIFSADGKLVKTAAVLEKSIPVTHLKPGLYRIRFFDRFGNGLQRLLMKE
jgi:hypothetical protein